MLVPRNPGTVFLSSAPEPSGTDFQVAATILLIAPFSVPGTVGNRHRSAVGTGTPSLEGNRVPHLPRGVPSERDRGPIRATNGSAS